MNTNKILSLRDRVDYRLDKDKPVICMVDGRAFSKLIKNKFELPFSNTFIQYMNQSALYTCKYIPGCLGAYVQSDEISFLIDNRQKKGDVVSEPYFRYRLCKMNSIIASTVTAKFNQLIFCNSKNPEKEELVQFDCKCWNVNDENDMLEWISFRQIDCIRNSKQQAAQTYLSYKKLLNLTADGQIKLLEKEKGICWKNYKEGEKYGRFIWKEDKILHNSEFNVDYMRSVWEVHDGWKLDTEEGKDKFLKLWKNVKNN